MNVYLHLLKGNKVKKRIFMAVKVKNATPRFHQHVVNMLEILILK